MSEQTNSAWGGRFSEATDQFVAEFTASINFDQRMYRQDIQGSIAHATMLSEVGVLTQTEKEQIISGLQAVQNKIEAGDFAWHVLGRIAVKA